ncbi:hypothetical protein F4810DRAFT_274699 [Camillea tinctor]|nr:hypothetical protein F4810DRAFT_274699 [Camillea tinctor]
MPLHTYHQIAGKELASAESPFDWRLLPLKHHDDPSQIRTYGFVRFLTPTGDTHLLSMAFLSDQSLFELSIFANLDSVNEEIRSLAMSTTLDSHVSFYAPVAKSDMWMICESRTSWGAGGRIATNQQFWDLETGALLMSCSQDAVVSPPKPLL